MREILKRERMKQKLTQQELADKAGISRVHYTQIENASNKKSPSLEVALKIKTALCYNSDDLFLDFDVSTAFNKNAGSIRKKLIKARGNKSQADVVADMEFSQKYIFQKLRRERTMKKEKRELSPWGKQCKVQMAVLDKSLADLSAETKLSRTYISSIINGRMIPPEETIRTISNALEVDISKIAEYLGTSVSVLLRDSRASEVDSSDVQNEKCQIYSIPSENLIAELKRRGYKVFKEV